MKSTPLAALALASYFLAASSLVAAGSRTLFAKHEKHKVSCFDCHQKEVPDHAAVPDESCMNCHGDWPAMAAYTKKLAVNPHAPPTTNNHPRFACPDCHHQHKPGEIKCLECHETFKDKLKLPTGL